MFLLLLTWIQQSVQSFSLFIRNSESISGEEQKKINTEKIAQEKKMKQKWNKKEKKCIVLIVVGIVLSHFGGTLDALPILHDIVGYIVDPRTQMV